VVDSAKCPRCDGCGLISSSDDGAPWTEILKIPLGSSAGVLMGLIRPLPCRECGIKATDQVYYQGQKYIVKEVFVRAGKRWVRLGDYVEVHETEVHFRKSREELIADKLMEEPE
jgi:hypothetical protein